MTNAEQRRILYECDMHPSAKLLLAILAMHADAQDRARPGRITLCELTGLKDRRVRAILAELIEAGWLKEIEYEGYEGWKILTRESGNVVPESGNVVPESGNVVPKIGNVVPKIGNVVPTLLYIREEPRRNTCTAGERVETFSDEEEAVDYRGTRQPLARLAWAETHARKTLENLGVDLASLPGQDLRAEWQAFLVGRAERSRTTQAPMLAVDQATNRLREAMRCGGMAGAVDAVRYAIAVGSPWPVLKPAGLKPAGNGRNREKNGVNSFGGELMTTYAGTAQTGATDPNLAGF